MNFLPFSLGSIIAVIVLVAVIGLGLNHRISEDVALLIGALAVARLT